ncbi:6-carboxytetrahydropterin synthase [Larsenimonas rhizosphaerae]|uniref:6-carboxy-5,6,7,8-tetrahydropterin synthase n=1 Tax=Larsenimonas rhizosphaerae TaxID=2944682 RepID=A0AA41ZEF4_9GAMM|nr:6-carboxytetrahydropterin synthase [Larsenimonas rhizosphaerae]MCM2130361.1 6-carboxytetrahydropterin synthase [Larsenimonas rhizosphaerae]MCX2523066.1 6-carboxytetrahydropterin synthase [Larsenimonas rhizosphaerae]
MTLFVNALTQLDASFWDNERGLVGASWHVDVTLDGELGDDGMLFDFGEVKPWVKRHIDGESDHTLLVPTLAPGVVVSECAEGLCVQTTHPWPMEVRAPRQAFTLLPWPAITTARLGEYISEQLMKRPPARVTAIDIHLAEEQIDSAHYTYTHGLKQHAGNCQRIAHGHRSRFYVWRDGELDNELSLQWAHGLQDIYLADQADVIQPEDDFCRVAYTSAQGHFRIKLPRERVMIMPMTSTVENIARWLADRIAALHGGHIRVQAFEGIGKGAVAEAEHTL